MLGGNPPSGCAPMTTALLISIYIRSSLLLFGRADSPLVHFLVTCTGRRLAWEKYTASQGSILLLILDMYLRNTHGRPSFAPGLARFCLSKVYLPHVTGTQYPLPFSLMHTHQPQAQTRLQSLTSNTRKVGALAVLNPKRARRGRLKSALPV
jgi:hypothetical protein